MPQSLGEKAFTKLHDGLSVQNPTIKTHTAIAMLVVAVTLDLAGIFIELIPLLGLAFAMIVPFLGIVIFGIWFATQGVSYFGGKKAGLKILSSIGATVLEMTPLINMMIPGITLGVFGIIYATRQEDKEREAEERKKKQQGQQGPGGRYGSTTRFGPTKISMPQRPQQPAEREPEMA